MVVKRMLTVLILTQITFKYVNSGGESFAPVISVFDAMRQDTSVNIVDPTLENVSLNFATEILQSTKIIPRVRFVQTTTKAAIIPDDKSLDDCLYDEDSGDLINTSGNCDHSCADGKIIEIFFIAREMFCCCRLSVVDKILIYLPEFDITALSSTETSKEDTSMTVTEVSVSSSTTTVIPLINSEDRPMRDCLHNSNFGDLISATGNCDQSCVDGKITEIVSIGDEKFCCCKRSVTSVADTTLINFSTIESSFDTTILISTETTKEDAMTVTEMSVSPSITTIVSLIYPQDEPIQDCTYNAQSGELTSSSGSCLDSCLSNKMPHSFYINNLLLCCCKPIQNEIEVILPQDMPLEDCAFDPISHEVTNIGGDCYESCADGKFIAMYQVSKTRTLCCCK